MKMNTLEQLQYIFNLLHDGGIENYSGDSEKLQLEIGCIYLAEHINPAYENFYIELEKIEKFELHPWWKTGFDQDLILNDFKEIAQLGLDIGSADIQDDFVIIYCSHWGKDGDFVGGNIHLKCQSVKIFDHQKNEITIQELDKIAQEYWDNFGTKSKPTN